MKKNKTPDPLSGDFKNKPFGMLKQFKPAAAAPEKTKHAHKKSAGRSGEHGENDEALFLRAMEGARPMHESARTVTASPRQKTPVSPAAAEEDEKLFLQAMQKMGTTFRDSFLKTDNEDTEFRSSSNRMRQLKRGTIRISQELDLHGYLKEEALARLGHFIGDAFSRGQKAVLVITGKGINSPEGPVLQGAVAAWLRGQGKALVSEFFPAPQNRGGSGAFVIFLKAKKKG